MSQPHLNVCLLSDSYPPAIDGVINCVMSYADIIQRQYGTAIVCTPRYPKYTDRFPYEVLRYPSFSMNRVFGYRAGFPLDRRTLRTLSQKRLDILHTHCPIMSCVMARALREMIHRPIVLTYHSQFDQDILQDIHSKVLQEQAFEALAANIDACDEIWTVSHGAAKSLRTLGYQGDYIVMENGVDLPKQEASPEQTAAISREYGLTDDTPVLLFVGRMMWYKGLHVVLDGLDEIRRQGVPFRMLFVGDGMDKEEIVASARSLNLEDHCQFIPAVKDREKLRAFYTRADLFLFPSDYDTNGLVVREAAACGTAALTLKDSCAAEGITHLKNGLTIDNSAEALAREVIRLLQEPGAARRLGQNAMDDLYISWEESVARAYQRYGVVMDRFMTNRHIRRGKSDAFFRAVARLYRARR